MFLIKASYSIYSCGAFFRWKNMRYGIEKTDKAGVYIGSFKEFIGKGYRDIVNNVFDFKYIYINLNELETSNVETEEIKHWIKAYNDSKTLKELRENLAREDLIKKR